MYKILDKNNWVRKSQYDWFSTFANPCYGMDVKIDVTDIVNYSKNTKTSFFINFLYIITKSLNSIEEMRYRIVNNEIRIYDTINPTFTVMTKINVFENAGFKMIEDYKGFYNKCHEVIEEIKNHDFINDGYNDNNGYDDYYMTCTPWLNYVSMTHPLPDNNPSSSSVPRVCWGKFVSENDCYNMMLNITVSHCLVDGFPLCKAFNVVQENCHNIEKFFK